MEIETTIKKIGNSFGVLFPKEFVKEKSLQENKKVIINIIKVADLSDIFGSLKGKIKMSGQKMKDLAREGWEK
ncbi:MAG TPA: hypothetical protein ENG87_03685 [Candidatus Pacearchaeota archaeon]|nr:hypothetical protein BMS3Abin17_00853 [archaeon BMS3Abin17]HDK42454.1 hypothetical protein [Candidatus Pacearchaeota archaeon]HDZ61336.1 hypothetical protein [Candidatus Pacearchaeota archaeon]